MAINDSWNLIDGEIQRQNFKYVFLKQNKNSKFHFELEKIMNYK